MASKAFRIGGVESRREGAIGVYEIRHCVVYVPVDTPNSRDEAMRLGCEMLRSQGYETRFPASCVEWDG